MDSSMTHDTMLRGTESAGHDTECSAAHKAVQCEVQQRTATQVRPHMENVQRAVLIADQGGDALRPHAGLQSLQNVVCSSAQRVQHKSSLRKYRAL